MDYKLLLHNYAAGREVAGWPRQRLIHACLRAAILDGSLPAGARLLASRELAAELGIARNTVLYAYDQLATEGLVRAGARGTVVAHLGLAATAPPNAAELPLARRMRTLRALPPSSDLAGAFAPGVPALAAFPLAAWRRAVERSWRAMSPADLNYADPAGVPALRTQLAAYLAAARTRCSSPAAASPGWSCARAPSPTRATRPGWRIPATRAPSPRFARPSCARWELPSMKVAWRPARPTGPGSGPA